MVKVNKKKLCENCFEEISTPRCPCCGYDPSDSVSSPTLLQPGSILSEKYIVGGVIGKGGFGVTYLAYDKSGDRKAAIKEYFPRELAHRAAYDPAVSVDDPKIFSAGAEKLYQEAQIVSDFKDNPNIVEIYDVFRANNTVYLAMEFLRGKTIREYLCDCGTLDAPSALYIARCVLNALSEIHGVRVLHRDISPDNIILCGNDGIKLIDFGAARRLVEEHSQNFSAIVKYGFAPPEQYRRKTEQGAWSDLYSLGSTIYYSLTGDIPADPMARFDNDDTFTENAFGIDEGLWSVITKATKLNAEERYQNAEEMLAALDELSITPKPVTFPDDELFRPVFISRSESASAVSGAETQNGKYKKSFFARHNRAAAITGGAAAAAVISVFAVYSANGGFKPQASEPVSSEAVSSEPVSSEADPSDASSVPEAPPIPLTEAFPYFGEYENKAWYLKLNERERELYKIIYDGLSAGETRIVYPPMTFTSEETDRCYYACLYDNPWICTVGGYGKNYEDQNNNDICEDEEYIYFIEPDRLMYDMDANKMRKQIEETISGEGDTVERLRRVHDAMTKDVSIVARYTTQYCTHAYGSIVFKDADDMGIAQGFCVYAQAMGIPCRVVDGTKNGEIRAWCVVKLDDTWYNVDVYGDKFAQSAVIGTMNMDRDAVFHTYFLANDEYFKEMGYEPNGGWEVLGGEEFAADSPYENYFIQHIEGVDEYFSKDWQSAYDKLLQKASEAVQSGQKEVSVCVAPYLLNDLFDSTNDTFISDCREKYGVSISRYTVKCDPSSYTVTLVY
ncbi:MAG: protein kinase [Oscillospiraceae bacterium]|nr:protein kinase [Oscillospiraceae bacterium]